MNLVDYIAANYVQIFTLLVEHIKLTSISVGLEIIIGIPLVIFISHASRAS